MCAARSVHFEWLNDSAQGGLSQLGSEFDVQISSFSPDVLFGCAP